MEKKYHTFLERLKTATRELRDEMLYMQDIVERSENEITNSLQGIFAEAEWVDLILNHLNIEYPEITGRKLLFPEI